MHENGKTDAAAGVCCHTGIKTVGTAWKDSTSETGQDFCGVGGLGEDKEWNGLE